MQGADQPDGDEKEDGLPLPMAERDEQDRCARGWRRVGFTTEVHREDWRWECRVVSVGLDSLLTRRGKNG